MSRMILKISGEALKSNGSLVFNDKLDIILKTIESLKDEHQIGIVIGGGNFFRGREHTDMDKVTADTIGMLGTVMNALYVKDYLEKHGLKTTISTPFDFPGLINKYSDEELKNKYNNGEIIIFGGGVGKSGFSTDSGTVLASEKLDSDLIVKMTNVDGVYDSDPKINLNAKKFSSLSYQEVLDRDLKVMDSYAIKKCQDKNTKILVINFNDYINIKKYFDGENLGTIIGV
ncbi:MAG: uridine monophosphate kinase [Bacilli bacterium]|nr:uridine monophosphate kinase [Bacilli bacterium]